MLTTGNQNARKNGVRFGARLGAVAAIGFAGDNRRADHSFSLVVGGLQTVEVEETQQMRAVFAEPFGEASIIFVCQPALWGNELIQLGFEAACSLSEGKGSPGLVFQISAAGLLATGRSSAEQSAMPGQSSSPACPSDRKASDPHLSVSANRSSASRHTQETIRGQDAFELLAQISITTSLERLVRIS